MNDKIIQSLHTVNDRDTLLLEISTLMKAVPQGNNKVIDESIRQSTLGSLGETLINDFTKLEKLKKVIESLPVIKLIISFQPRPKTTSRIHDWIVGNVSDSLLLDIQIDPRVIGGAEIEHFGKYIDLGLRKRFSKREDRIRKTISEAVFAEI